MSPFCIAAQSLSIEVLKLVLHDVLIEDGYSAYPRKHDRRAVVPRFAARNGFV